MPDNPLRRLPKMDLLLSHPLLLESGLPRALLRAAAREELGEARRTPGSLPGVDELARRTAARAAAARQPHLRRVINATGVVLHTNLGRAPLAEWAAQAAYEAARGYSNLEYDLETGTRGSRHAHVESLLCKLTGAEAALCVNNNAAALCLMLSALGLGKGVAVSRGELVEIGGGFRVPDIMARSGARLIEVGTTNKTRLADYRRAGAELLLKVHTSNYEILGFTEETTLAQLSQLGLPLLCDLGSGALSEDIFPQLPCPTVEGALRDGAHVVCFSGDKLLGGPQAGVAVGRKEYIEAMKQDPMARAFRIDKLSLAALEATLQLYEGGWEHIPTLSMLNATPEELREKALALARRCGGEVLPVRGQVGGGSMPNLDLPSWAVAVRASAAQLRRRAVPIIARTHRGRVLLDVRTLSGEDMDEIVEALTHG